MLPYESQSDEIYYNVNRRLVHFSHLCREDFCGALEDDFSPRDGNDTLVTWEHKSIYDKASDQCWLIGARLPEPATKDMMERVRFVTFSLNKRK